MNIPLIIGLMVALLLLVVGYGAWAQYRQKVESEKRQELNRYHQLIETTEDMISSAHYFPYTKELLICLNQRIYDALVAMKEIDPSDKQLGPRIANIEAQIKQLAELFNNSDIATFKVPTTEKQALGMLQLVKRLRTVIKAEHSKGRLSTQVFVAENARLESMQLRINIENVVKRANDAKLKNQVGTAKQLLKKGLDVLATKNDDYSNNARDRLTAILNDIEQGHSENQHKARQEMLDRDKDDIDALFQPKKKW
uniref:DNA repair protein n=1 Tax=Thaumasiovibrio occultus TaxID=1891184 RepID=UPI000B3606E0|nr:DNA repair protein [Thaumasiovibrio occultus]